MSETWSLISTPPVGAGVIATAPPDQRPLADAAQAATFGASATETAAVVKDAKHDTVGVVLEHDRHFGCAAVSGDVRQALLCNSWDIAATQSVTAWIPVMIFAFLFGLSMDYEVFMPAPPTRPSSSGSRPGSSSTPPSSAPSSCLR